MTPFPKNPIKFMWLYALRNKGLFFLIVVAMILDIGAQKLVPYYFSKLTGLFGEEVDFRDIRGNFMCFLGMMALCAVLGNLLNFAQQFLVSVRLEPTVFKQMSADLFLYLSKHSVQFFADNMAGALASKSNTLTENAAGSYVPFLYYLTKAIALLFTFAVLLTVNFLFAFTFLGLILVSILGLFKIGKQSIRQRAEMAKAKNNVSGNMIDALQNNFFVRIFNGNIYETKRAEKLLKEESAIANYSAAIEMLVSSGQKLYFDVFYLLFLLYGFYLWRGNFIDGAQLILIFLLLKDVSDDATFLIHRGIIYSGILSEMRENLIPFTIPHDISDKKDATRIRISKGEIEFKNVTFSYKDGKPIFKHFSLIIPAREKVGIVGTSGSGKSTFINLIERFYDIQDGEILIDGQNICNVTQESLHQSIGLISQTTTLLERTIEENIAYGKPEATESAIINSAKKAYAHEFIAKLALKYKTMLSGCNRLSGGERQRISIARAILKDAPILILDEATSALDSQSENYIQQAIEEVIKDKTVIAIAHRLSTLRNMDRIVVLEDGQIVEEGKLEDLLKKKGKFFKLWNLQQTEEKKGGQ